MLKVSWKSVETTVLQLNWSSNANILPYVTQSFSSFWSCFGCWDQPFFQWTPAAMACFGHEALLCHWVCHWVVSKKTILGLDVAQWPAKQALITHAHPDLWLPHHLIISCHICCHFWLPSENKPPLLPHDLCQAPNFIRTDTSNGLMFIFFWWSRTSNGFRDCDTSSLLAEVRATWLEHGITESFEPWDLSLY